MDGEMRQIIVHEMVDSEMKNQPYHDQISHVILKLGARLFNTLAHFSSHNQPSSHDDDQISLSSFTSHVDSVR